MQLSAGGYGAELDAIAVTRFLDHVLGRNLQVEASTGRRGTPVCLWGPHGVGKTALVTAFAQQRGWKLAYCAPAQFEEMGDLHGLPTRVDPDPAVMGDEYTVFAPPAWVPQEDGPGILLLDDINRADDRILRGIMQLLQNFEMFSWTLPKRWQIVATANPDNGDYSVTPMDDAMLTRMLHVRMRFDLRAWITWAMQNDVDPRGIDFVLSYPEMAAGKRTTPRSLAQLFDHLRGIPDLRSSRDLVYALASGALDESSAASFMAFVDDNLSRLPVATDVLCAESFDSIEKKLIELAGGGEGTHRVDRLSAVCVRVLVHLGQADVAIDERTLLNLTRFVKLTVLPNDLRMSLHRDLLALGRDPITQALRDSELAMMLLDGM